MALDRRYDGSDPIRPEPVARLHEERRATGTWHLAGGTLACPQCDAPVALTSGAVSPATALACPFCEHAAAVRDFLSLAAPARPARVEVRIVAPASR